MGKFNPLPFTLETVVYTTIGATMGACVATFPAILEIVAGHDLDSVVNNIKDITIYAGAFACGMKLLDCYLSGDKNNYSQTF